MKNERLNESNKEICRISKKKKKGKKKLSEKEN